MSDTARRAFRLVIRAYPSLEQSLLPRRSEAAADRRIAEVYGGELFVLRGEGRKQAQYQKESQRHWKNLHRTILPLKSFCWDKAPDGP